MQGTALACMSSLFTQLACHRGAAGNDSWSRRGRRLRIDPFAAQRAFLLSRSSRFEPERRGKHTESKMVARLLLLAVLLDVFLGGLEGGVLAGLGLLLGVGLGSGKSLLVLLGGRALLEDRFGAVV